MDRVAILRGDRNWRRNEGRHNKACERNESNTANTTARLPYSSPNTANLEQNRSGFVPEYIPLCHPEALFPLPDINRSVMNQVDDEVHCPFEDCFKEEYVSDLRGRNRYKEHADDLLGYLVNEQNQTNVYSQIPVNFTNIPEHDTLCAIDQIKYRIACMELNERIKISYDLDLLRNGTSEVKEVDEEPVNLQLFRMNNPDLHSKKLPQVTSEKETRKIKEDFPKLKPKGMNRAAESSSNMSSQETNEIANGDCEMENLACALPNLPKKYNEVAKTVVEKVEPEVPVVTGPTYFSLLNFNIEHAVISVRGAEESLVDKKILEYPVIRKYAYTREKIVPYQYPVVGVITSSSTEKSSLVVSGKSYCIWTVTDWNRPSDYFDVLLYEGAFRQFANAPKRSVVAIANPRIKNNEGTVKLAISRNNQVTFYGLAIGFIPCQAVTTGGKPCSKFVNGACATLCRVHLAAGYKSVIGTKPAVKKGLGQIERNPWERQTNGNIVETKKVALPSAHLYDRDNLILRKLSNNKTPPTDSKPNSRVTDSRVQTDSRATTKVQTDSRVTAKVQTDSRVTAKVQTDSKITATNNIDYYKNGAIPKHSRFNKIQDAGKTSSVSDKKFNGKNMKAENNKAANNACSNSFSRESLQEYFKKDSPKNFSHASSNKTGVPIVEILPQSKPSSSFNMNLNSTPSTSKCGRSNSSGMVKNSATKMNTTNVRTNEVMQPSTVPSPMRTQFSAVGTDKFSINQLGKAPRRNDNTIKKTDYAKAEALQYVRQNGPIGNNDRKKKHIVNTSPELTQKRAKFTPEPASQGAACVLGTNFVNIVGNGFASEQFVNLMNVKSKHEDLVEDADEKVKNEYFDKMSKKEEIEESMLSTYRVPCKIVICNQCNYKSLFPSDLCLARNHRLVYMQSEKRFFQCSKCLNRIVELEVFPTRCCDKCFNFSWIRVAMLDERKTIAKENILSVRGDEQKFFNAHTTDANLNLLVPE